MQGKIPVSDNRRRRGGARVFAWAGGIIAVQAMLAMGVFVLPLGMAGCGVNVADLANQAGDAAFNTFFDLWLTDLVNSAAELRDGDVPDDGDGDGDDGDGDGEPVVPDGDSVAGEAAYQAAGCAACHGASGEGGSAPVLFGVNELAALEQRFADGAVHLGTTLTDEEVVDVATWLLGDDDDDDEGEGEGGDEDDGEGDGGGPDGAELFAASCASCHGADGTGGAVFAGDITGTSSADLTAALDLGIHGSVSYSPEEVDAVASFLGG